LRSQFIGRTAEDGRGRSDQEYKGLAADIKDQNSFNAVANLGKILTTGRWLQWITEQTNVDRFRRAAPKRYRQNSRLKKSIRAPAGILRHRASEENRLKDGKQILSSPTTPRPGYFRRTFSADAFKEGSDNWPNRQTR